MAEDPINQEIFEEDVASSVTFENSAGGEVPSGNFKMPSVEEIWKLVEQMEGISPEEREDIRENLFNPKEQSSEELYKRMGHPGHSSKEYLIFFIMIAIVVLVFDSLQTKLDALTDTEKLSFVKEMKGSFMDAIQSIEKRLAVHENFKQTYSASIAAAIIFSIVLVFALFGYKLYKSLMDKELKKQEKLKQKNAKKTKKSN